MRGSLVVFNNFSGGVDKNTAPYLLDPSQAQDLLNVVGINGQIRRRNGFVSVASPTLPITSLSTFERGSSRYLIGIGDNGTSTDIYSITQAGTVTSRKGAATVTAGNRWDIQQAPAHSTEGPVYMMNGVDTPLYWSGSGNVGTWTAATGTLPNGKYMIYFDNRLFVGGVSSYLAQPEYTTRSMVAASAIANPRDWISPNGVTNLFDPDDGEEVSSLGVVGPYPLVSKPRKTYVIHNTDTLGYRQISNEIGCVANRSVTQTDRGTFFLTSDKKIAVTDGSSVDIVSTPIEPILDLIPSSKIGNAAATFYNNRYYLSVTLSTVNDIIFEFDTNSGSWWIHKISLDAATTTGVNDWAILDPQGAATFYAAGASTSTPRVFDAFKADTYGDMTGTTAFTSYWTSGWLTFDRPHLRTIVRQVRADAKGNFTLKYSRSMSNTVQNTEDVEWETADESDEHRYYTLGNARAWSFRIENTEASEFMFNALTLALDTRTD